MALQQILESGILSRLYKAIDRGMSEARIESLIWSIFPTNTYASIQAAYARAMQGYAAGRAVDTGTAAIPMPVGLIPGYYPGRTDFVYTVRVRFNDSGSGDPVYRYEQVRSDHQLTRDQIADRIDPANPNPPAGTRIDNASPPTAETRFVLSFDVLGIERDD